MTSLTDVYEGDVGRVASRRQQLVGSGLFLAGAASLVGAIALATTDVGTTLGLGEYAAREMAGIVAGIGLPTVVLGVFAVLPASLRVRVTAVVGTGVSLVGVAAFQQIYPYQWMSGAPMLALGTSILYVGGIVTAFACLFVALATFKTREDPGGSARMAVTEEGTITLVEDDRSGSGMGGIGFFGSDPDGTVETQTNRTAASGTVGDGGTEATTPSTPGPTDTERRSSGPSDRRTDTSPTLSESDVDPVVAGSGPEGSTSTDGGTTSAVGHDAITEAAVHGGEPDRYCGNCRHFQYVMDDGDIEPYCGHHDQLMDDMEPCPAWLNND